MIVSRETLKGWRSYERIRKNALRKIDEEMGKVSEQIEIYVVKRDNEKSYLTNLTLEEKVSNLIGVYHGL